MSLWKRGGVWWNFFQLDGIRHQISTGTSNRRQADLIAQKQRQEANARRFQLVDADPNMSFGALAARFIASGTVGPHHLYHLKILLPFFADFPVMRINKSQVEEFRRARRKENPKVKDATVNRDVSVLRRILYWAVEESLMLANPLARLRMARERRTRKPVLSVAEEDLLLGAASKHLQGIVITALDTGMRRGEVLGQRWEHIDFPRRLLFVTKSKTPEGESREIPLTARLFDLLSARQRKEGVIFTYHGNPFRDLKTAWRIVLQKSGIRHVRFHDLRHTFNTRLMEAGVMQEVRMALMGHSSGRTVHSIYTHVELPVKREAIARLEQWVQQQRQGGQHASETADRSSAGQASGTQTLEKENSSGSSS